MSASGPAPTSRGLVVPVRVAGDAQWTRWAALALIGLATGAVGLAGASGRSPEGGPALRLVARVPDPLVSLALASGTLAALLVLWLLVPRGVRRRRRKGDEEFELYHEPQKVRAWVAIALVMALLAPFAAGGYALVRGWMPPALGHGARSLSHSGEASPRLPAAVPIVAPVNAASPRAWTAAVAAVCVVAGLGSLVIVSWLLFGDGLARWWAGPLPEGSPRMLAQAVEESLFDLAREPDARRAIIRCYRRFEELLAVSRLPRAPWLTPTEFMREALGRRRLPRRAVERLTWLFQVARFGDQTLEAADRSAALESLGEIRASLKGEGVDGTPA